MSKLVIFSAPSGSGKSTIIKELLRFPDLNFAFSISTTSRNPRGEEQNGVDYHFVSAEVFKKQIQENAFLEWEEVYKDTFYGTYKSEIERLTKLNKNILFDIDVFGGINIKKQFGEKALAIFVQPPSLEVLKERLEARNTDSAEKIAIRLAKASHEMEQSVHFDAIIVNDNLQKTIEKTLEIVHNFLKN